MITEFNGRLTVGILESQPLLIEGLRRTLEATGCYALLEPAQSLDSLTQLVIAASPRMVIIDKACGMTSIIEWLTRIRDRTSTAAVVWGNALNDAEALRLLRAGARGVIRKTAGTDALLACLDSIANGGTWMEDVLFQQTARSQSANRGDLTPREQQVLELVSQGMRNKEIAEELGIRPGTVKIHLKHIFEKTGVHGRFGLALSGFRDQPDSNPFRV